MLHCVLLKMRHFISSFLLPHLPQPALQLQQSSPLGLLLLTHLVQVLLQFGVLGLQLPCLRLQVELLLP